MTKNRLVYHKQTRLEQFLQNELNIDYFTCDKNICVYGFAYMTKLESRSIQRHQITVLCTRLACRSIILKRC